VPSASATPALPGPSIAEAPAQTTQAAADPVAAGPQPALMPARDHNPSATPASHRPPRNKALLIGLGGLTLVVLAAGIFAAWWFLWPRKAGLIREAKYFPEDCYEIQVRRPDKMRASKHYQDIMQALKKRNGGEDTDEHVFGLRESEIVRVIRMPPGIKGSKFGGMTIVTMKKEITPAEYKKVGHQGKEWHEERVGPYTIFYHDAGTFCIPEPHIVLFAGRDDLREILKREGDPAFSGSFAKMLSQADFDVAETGVVVHQPGGPGLFSALGAVGTKDFEGMVTQADAAEDVSLRTVGFYKDEAAARRALTQLEEAWEKLKAGSEQYRRLAETQSMKLAQAGNTVTLTGTIRTVDVIADITRDAKGR
jgi:hypothetical protein